MNSGRQDRIYGWQLCLGKILTWISYQFTGYVLITLYQVGFFIPKREIKAATCVQLSAWPASYLQRAVT